MFLCSQCIPSKQSCSLLLCPGLGWELLLTLQTFPHFMARRAKVMHISPSYQAGKELPWVSVVLAAR